jgi:ankyrin repeat protein
MFNFNFWCLPKYSQEDFYLACTNGEIEKAKNMLLLNPKLRISESNELIFRICCIRGHIEIIKWLLECKPDIDINIYDNTCFYVSCVNGHYDIVKLLMYLQPNIIYKIKDIDSLFSATCGNGHIKIAKLLLSNCKTILISSNNDSAFREACSFGHIEMSKWLVKKDPLRYYLELENNMIKKHYILNYPIIFDEIEDINKDQECLICLEDKVDLTTNCHHKYCSTCIIKWCVKNKTCPYCLQNIEYFFVNS